MKFDIRFYLVAIMFIRFDIEVIFLMPWAAKVNTLGLPGLWAVMVFLSLLTIGLAYEWKRGALERKWPNIWFHVKQARGGKAE